MKRLYCLYLLAGLLISATSFAQQDPRLAATVLPLNKVERIVMPELDNAQLRADELERQRPGRPPKFAESLEVSISPDTHGTWEQTEDGKWVWRLRIYSKGAKSLNLGFSEYSMPDDGTLILYTPSKDFIAGPFSVYDNEAHNQLWTPIIEGDEIVLEVAVPERDKERLKLHLQYINHDFMGFQRLATQSCHIDVNCGEEDGYAQIEGYRDAIQSVAVYSLGGDRLCTGFLVGNAEKDETPYFMTAFHCEVDAGDAPSLVAYWEFENSTCREPGSAASAGAGDGPLSVFNTGSIYRAGWETSDFVLLELDDPVACEANPFFAGWDISNNLETGTVACVHHPDGQEKRISFANDGVYVGAWGSGSNPVANGDHLIVSDWDAGSTEMGSSGAPLFDSQQRVIGQLHGGGASCSNDSYDAFGWMRASWFGPGNSPSTRLKDWLDPNDTGVEAIDGYYPYEYTNTPTEVSGELLIDTDTYYSNDIIVKTGGHLRVTATLRMSPPTRIVVQRGAKLTVDGGKITVGMLPCGPEGTYWKGITLEGNNNLPQPSDPFGMPAVDEAGIVLAINEAEIEWGRHAISVNTDEEWWNPVNRGGLVYCENMSFVNCYRAVEFMNYPFQNKSRFTNCTFDASGIVENGTFGNLGGVSIWETDGIVFDRCTFKGMNGYGVLALDAGVRIQNGCKFEQSNKGVSIRASSPFAIADEVYIRVDVANVKFPFFSKYCLSTTYEIVPQSSCHS